MNISQKVDILYRIARDESVSSSERKEVKKYKVDSYCGTFLATKKNLRAYVKDVDEGKTHANFYSWCSNNGLADARRKGGSKKEMKSWAKSQGSASTIIGGVAWACAIMQLTNNDTDIAMPFIVGCIISFIINSIARDRAFLFNVILPIFIASIFVAG